MLRGGEGERIRQFGHDKLSTYGIGKDLSKQAWSLLARQLVQQGLLQQDPEYNGLSLTAAALPVLKSETAFLGNPLEIAGAPARSSRETTAAKADIDNDLFEILRKRRKELADEQNLAPYMIFSDKTLIDMCAKLPQTREELLNVHGVAETKMRRYGDEFLPFLRAHANGS